MAQFIKIVVIARNSRVHSVILTWITYGFSAEAEVYLLPSTMPLYSERVVASNECLSNENHIDDVETIHNDRRTLICFFFLAGILFRGGEKH